MSDLWESESRLLQRGLKIPMQYQVNYQLGERMKKRLPILFLIFWFGAMVPLTAAPVSANLISEGWKHRIYLVYPPEKLKADEQPAEGPRVKSVQLSAAQGETEPFLLVLRPEVPLRDVDVRLSAFTGPDGAVIPAPKLPARHLGYIYIDEPSGTRIAQKMPFETGTGLFPDPLLRGLASVRPSHNLQFWVAVNVPQGTSAGLYHGEAIITFRKEGWMPPALEIPVRVPVELTVRNFALPQPSPLLNTAFYSANQISKLSAPAGGRPLYDDFAAHRQTPEPILPAPELRVLAGPELSVDLTGWEKEAAYILEEMKLPQVFLPVWGSARGLMQGVYFLWHFPAVTRQRWPAFPAPGLPGAFVCDEEGALTVDFKALFGNYLKAANALVERRGWAGRVLVSTMDEPYTSHVVGEGRARDIPKNNYAVIRSLVGLIRESAPLLRTFCTANPVPELEGQIDQWCLRNLEAAGSGKFPEPTGGGVLTLCDNYRTFIDYPMVAPRTLGWLCWKTGARGWLTFETMGELEKAWQEPVLVYPQFKGGTVWGMGQLFYPDPAGKGLVPSVRWEMMRKGAEDYEYLWLLEQRLNELFKAKQNSTLAQEARAFLANAAEGVAGVGSELETSSSAARPNTQTQALPHRLREEAAQWLERLSAPAK